MMRIPSLTKTISSNSENNLPVLRRRNSSNSSSPKSVPPAGAIIVQLVRKREEKFESKDNKISPSKQITPSILSKPNQDIY